MISKEFGITEIVWNRWQISFDFWV